MLRAGADEFKVLLYNFTDEPMTGNARFWGLDHGRYSLTLGPDANGDDEADSIDREDEVEIIRAAPVSLTLPPKTVVVLELAQLEELDDLWARPDLAISELDTELVDGTLTVRVHNIGGADAPATSVALMGADGEQVASKDVPALAAPLDLDPKVTEVSLDGARPGMKLVLDPDGAIAEIHEGNNAIVVPEG